VEQAPAVEKAKEKAPVTKVKPEAAPKPAKSLKPAPRATENVSDPELERAWEYYRKAAARDTTDHEKIEILESMLLKFGERGAAKINKELMRIRKRLE
jgi:hypothetical protein